MSISAITIRRARPEDAPPLVDVIHRALWETNLPDYGAENVARVASHFTEATLRAIFDRTATFVAVDGDRPVGMAGVGPNARDARIAIRTFFVDPGEQRRGIGTRLLAAVEDEARQQSVTLLPVRSSIAGEPFYARHGYEAVSDHWDGDERTILMEKPL